ncbi:PadR family transcriptional regulator [candidate division KSB1 bacterium]
MDYLTLSESILLLAIWRLKDGAYGVTIRKYIEEMTGKLYSYGTLYSFLDQLARKRYVAKSIGDPTPQRGGRSKIYYKLSNEGIRALQSARELQKTIWEDTEDLVIQ